jgi:Zn-dependent oligopeptidase
MPADLAERLAASRSVNLGSRYLASFGGYGAFDLSIHGPEPVDLDDAMRAADAIRLLPTIEGTFWPASFAHLMGGYDAGYYGYLWSLVYGDDLWSRFAEQGVTSPTVGLAYRREILEPGSSRDAEALVEAFLGRPSNDAAFLERTGIVRTPA